MLWYAPVPDEQPPLAENAAPASGIAPERVPAPAAMPERAQPWPRFWARRIDIAVSASLIAFLLGMVHPSTFHEPVFTGLVGQQLLGWLSLPFAMILDAVVYSVFGNTPGKWLAGVKVKRVDGQKVTFSTYVGRNFGVWWSGLGTGFPIVSLITLIVAHGKASDGEISSWDKGRETRTFAVSPGGERPVLAGSIYILMVIGFMALNMVEKTWLPPHSAPVVDTTPEGQLRQTAAEVSRMAPVMVSDGTRLDGASAGPGRSLTFRYTLTQIDITELGDPQGDPFMEWLRSQLREGTCKMQAFAALREIGATIRFSYADMTGRELATIEFAPGECAP
jgi:uncharacterized RDD family membrane protein YckC